MKFLIKSLILTIFLLSSFAIGGDLDGLNKEYVDFLVAETSNSYIASDSTVDVKYRADGIKPFKVGFLEIPSSELNIEVSSINEKLLNEHFFIEGSNRKKIRFFIHPDSEHLYKPLIEKYGYKGFYSAVATASTRTVLAWDPLRKESKPLFLKLSLAQIQDRLGRIIPGWEVRRSVRISETAADDIKSPKTDIDKVALIPEVAGAYVKAEQGMKFFVDSDQGQVSEHGFILRDASFIEANKGKKVVPMFWLFSKGNGVEPPIIELWRKSTYFTDKVEKQVISFNHFVVDFFFKPFIKQNLPLMVFQGIVPQIHGQNVVLILDPISFKIEKILHRDVGSMKADYRLRWLNGLSTQHLVSKLADKDFGLSWGAEQIEKYHISYLHDWLLQWGYLKDIKKVLPAYSPHATRQLVYKVLQDEIANQLNLKNKQNSPSVQIAEYISSNHPTKIEIQDYYQSVDEIKLEIKKRSDQQQVVDLPKGWEQVFSSNAQLTVKGFLITQYGIVFKSKLLGEDSNHLKIAFYESRQKSQQSRVEHYKMCKSLF